ncbi:MAG: hypothetical protein D6785_11835, partial [Planctomycetota bacterium]
MSTCETGKRIGAYILVEKLGEGGFGEVWKGKHHFLHHWAAIKILKPEFPKETLEKEGRLQAHLEQILEKEGFAQCGVIRLLGGNLWDPPFFLVMEFVEADYLGRTSLRDWLKHGPLSEQEAIEILSKIAAILSVAHR